MKKIFSGLVLSLYLCVTSFAQTAKPAIAYLPSDSLRNDPAPAFVLKNLQGKEISLAGLQGKVVVVDFWATWCKPCHESMVFVQKTMDQYKNDSNVVFLFIDAREPAGNRVVAVKRFLANNKYRLQVLFDEDGPEGDQNKVYHQFHTSGLPTRFVIDARGIVRFESVGNPVGKTPDELAAILTDMIERAKKSS